MVCWEEMTHSCGKYTVIVVILNSELTECGPHLSVYFFTTNFSINTSPPPQHTYTHTHTHISSKKDFHFRFPDHNCNYVTPIGFYFILNSRSKIKNVLSRFTIWHRIPLKTQCAYCMPAKFQKLKRVFCCVSKSSCRHYLETKHSKVLSFVKSVHCWGKKRGIGTEKAGNLW